MEMESVFKFTRFLVLLRKDNRVILINRNNGSWIKMVKCKARVPFVTQESLFVNENLIL